MPTKGFFLAKKNQPTAAVGEEGSAFIGPSLLPYGSAFLPTFFFSFIYFFIFFFLLRTKKNSFPYGLLKKAIFFFFIYFFIYFFMA
jgi:hypothetical protein